MPTPRACGLRKSPQPMFARRRNRPAERNATAIPFYWFERADYDLVWRLIPNDITSLVHSINGSKH